MHSLFSLLGGRVHRRGLELVTRYLQPGITEEATGPPKFLGNLDYPFARVLTDAGRIACTRPSRCSNVAPGPPSTEAPTMGLSTLNSTAFGLAVYASQGGSLQPHARLASGCWSGSTGWAFHPQDSVERFQDCVLTSPSSSPKLAWRKGGDRSALAACTLGGRDTILRRIHAPAELFLPRVLTILHSARCLVANDSALPSSR